jgi:transcriptional regulator with GAF, ATPase, and Fis domain
LIPLNDAVAKYVLRVLKRTNGKISGPNGAAEILGMHPNTLRNRMKKLGIPYKRAEFKKTAL